MNAPKDFRQFCASIGNLPSSYVDCMSYYELLMWLCNYVQTAYDKNVEELKTFCTEYLANLPYVDVINSKLDKMAQSGELGEIMAQYLTPIVNELNSNVDELKLSTNNKLSIQDTKIQQQDILLNTINNKVDNLTSGSPSGVYATVDALTTADPDHSKIYVVTATGNWYYYDDGWQSGGTYQANAELKHALGGINTAYTAISKTGATSYIASESRYRINEYEVSENSNYRIHTYIRGSNFPIVCFFNGDNFISYSGSVTSKTNPVERDVTITTPANCTRMIVNSYATNDCEVFGVGDELNSKYQTKTFMTLGDSRTWYDQQTYGNNTLDSGTKCNGYQYYMRKYLGINTYNYGANGYTTPQISHRICNPNYSFIYTTYNYILIDGGINDWLNEVPIGTIAPIGSTFDDTTVIGSLQKAIECIINNAPSVKIFLTAPYTGWNNGEEYTRNYTEARKAVAQLYSIPILDLDQVSRLNKANKNYYYVDDLEDVTYQLHLNNLGYEFIHRAINNFINNN